MPAAVEAEEAGSDADAASRLNKLAFWMATGSGKTLLMHAHLLLSGELALRLGDAAPFGVVNVGDAAALARACEDAGFNVTESEFKESVFDRVNDRDSTINLVVGARKFTEGWNSWRVSSMGLMNVGRSEGAQIIQMFGRGVRLKGRGMSLKRSSALQDAAREAPDALPTLETLQVFGVKADYMAQFRDFLEREGVAAEREEIFLPVRRRPLPADPPLGTIRLAKDVAGGEPEAAFRRHGPMPVLLPPAQKRARSNQRPSRASLRPTASTPTSSSGRSGTTGSTSPSSIRRGSSTWRGRTTRRSGSTGRSRTSRSGSATAPSDSSRSSSPSRATTGSTSAGAWTATN